MTRLRRATCQCGQLVAECFGDPVRISVCHCLDCQRRSGSSFAAQARFPEDRVNLSGIFREWIRPPDGRPEVVHHFCPHCGSEVWYRARAQYDLIAIPIGAFADPGFPAPNYSVFEDRKHRWVDIGGDAVEHFA